MEEKKDNFRHILRIAGTDLDGNKKLVNELRKIKGVSFLFCNVLCKVANVDKNQKLGYIDDASLARIEDVLKNPKKFNVPSWLLNRRADPETGIDKHLIASELKFTEENDIKFMKKIKSWKGMRHSIGQPVRGQRTKSNFRKNKGKVMGVAKTRQAKTAQTEKQEKKK